MNFISRYFDNYLLKRKNIAKDSCIEEIPYLISLQKKSYSDFLQQGCSKDKRLSIGIQSVFNSFFPISDPAGKVTIEFIDYTLEEPRYSPKEALFSGRTFSSPLRTNLRLILWDIQEEKKEVKAIKEQEIYLCDIPLMTEDGSFVVNGSERVIISQIRRAPGVFFDSDISKITNSRNYTAKIIPYIGSWLDFEFDSKDVLYFKIDRKRKVPVSSLLRAIGMTVGDIISYFYSNIKLFRKENGWVKELDFDYLLNKTLFYDIISCSDNKIYIKSGTKITKRVIKKLQDNNVTDCLLSDEVVQGYSIAQDLIDQNTGEVVLEAGNLITEGSLQIIDNFGLNSIYVVDPNSSELGPYIYNTLLIDKNQNEKEALYDIYRATKLGESPSSMEIAKNFFNYLFFSKGRYNLSEVGRLKMNHRLSLDVEKDITYLTPEDIKETIRILSLMKYNDLKTDDIDNLSNRRVRSVGELVENQLRIGISRMEKSVVEKISSSDVDSVMPQSLVNSKPLNTIIKDFFATSQLSQFMDQTNPLSEITHKRRISALGPGGLTRERALFEVRDVHPTHYGRICPIETPEGQNIGLINSLATYARVNDYGFIETPYFEVKNGVVTKKLRYLSAMEESGLVIAQSSVNYDAKGYIEGDLVSCRKDGEFILVSPDKINYIDISSKQIVSVAATLIPFLENDDANRALMGSNMQRQAVPLANPEVPLVGTGMESIIAYDSGAVVKNEKDGIVKFVDSSKILVESLDSNNLPEVNLYNLSKNVRTNQNTCVNQRPIVNVGDKLKAGQIISDGHSVKGGEIALGKNVRVAFMPWNGYNFEDSMVISERLIKDSSFTSIHIEELEVVARDTRLGPEEITRDIPTASDDSLGKLDEEGIIHVGAQVRHGDILVGKTTPKSESPITPEEKLLRVIFGEKSFDVKDTSLYASAGLTGKVIDVKIFSRKGIDKDERLLFIEMQEIEKIERDMKLQISFLKSAIKNAMVSLLKDEVIINNVKDFSPNTKLEKSQLNNLVFEDLIDITIDNSNTMKKIKSLVSSCKDKIHLFKKEFEEKVEKIKFGDDLPQGVLKIVKIYVASQYRLQPGDKMSGRHGNKGVVSRIVPVEDMPYDENGEPVDVILNPLGVPSRMNIGQVLETHLGWASVNIGRKISEVLSNISLDKKQRVCETRKKLLLVYNSKEEQDKINSMSDNALIEFANGLRHGVPFSTGVFNKVGEDYINEILKKSGMDTSGQVTLIDGISGMKFDRKVTLGYMYILKLHHLVDNKIHARSIGPYSLITQQPLGGKSHFGGQRFGEMECWALQAYGASYILQEMLTVKSDDVVGRVKIYESIIQGNQNFVYGMPESFNVMLKEVRSLGLNIELVEN